MSKIVSPYYPPRARRYSPVMYCRATVRRALALERIELPSEITVRGLIAGFVVPGLAVYLRGPRLLGQTALASCCALLLAFVVWLGYPAGNFAFGLLISIHTTGFIRYCGPLLKDARFRFRSLFTMAALLMFAGFIYLPLRSVFEDHWLTALRLNGRAIVVQRLASAKYVKRGDWIAYQLPEAREGAVVAVGGMSMGLVLADAGDRVEFSTNEFSVNGIARPRQPHMPDSGALIVAENQWFIWPDFGISGHGNVGEANISGMMMKMALVEKKQFFGKPFRRWFWMRQSVEKTSQRSDRDFRASRNVQPVRFAG